jgi:hypothetical protein
MSGQNALPTNGVTDADDYLPSIAEIVSMIEKAERSRSNVAGEHSQPICVMMC